MRLELDNWTGHRFTDLFTLLEMNGEWMIMNKVFICTPEEKAGDEANGPDEQCMRATGPKTEDRDAFCVHKFQSSVNIFMQEIGCDGTVSALIADRTPEVFQKAQHQRGGVLNDGSEV